MNARVSRQGGWTVGFILVGIVLAVLLIGGVVWLKSSQNDTGNVQETEKTEQAAENGTESGQDTDKPFDGQEPADDKSTEDSDNSSSQEGRRSPSRTDDSGKSEKIAKHAKQLPHTGPEDAIGNLAVVGLLAFAGVSYVRSRTIV